MLPLMILHRTSTRSRRHRPAIAPRDGSPAPTIMPVPAWLRRADGDDRALAAQRLEDVALAAGAALAVLDAVVRRRARWDGAWRQRLALSAAAVTTRQAGRAEDEAALRDAVLLTRPGDDVGPAGRMVLAWRRLVAGPAQELLTEASIAGVLDAVDLARDDETANDLADELRRLATTEGAVGMLVGALSAAERYSLPYIVGCWFADAMLAQRLGWTHAVPLLGTEAASGVLPGRRRGVPGTVPATGMETEGERARRLVAAQVRAALRAIDLATELERRADRLIAVAPKLRAKASDVVIERLLSEDAIVASQKIAGISDRGLRRLFDRLSELGAVRELTGRPTFRIYGL